MAHVNAFVSQQAFRGRNDDGTLATATDKSAGNNVNFTQAANQSFRLRFVLEETAGGSANNYSYILQYNRNGAGWINLSTTGAVRSAPSAFVANGAATAQRISAGAFVAGEFDSSSDTSNISLSLQKTEMEYCLLLDGSLVNNNDTIQFRVTNAGTPLNGYTNTPTITADVTLPAISGALSTQESAQDSLSVQGAVSLGGAMMAAETGSDSLSATAGLFVTSDLQAQEQGAESFNGSGAVTDPSLIASLQSQEDGDDHASAGGVTVIAGALASQESFSDDLNATGNNLVAISLAVQESGRDGFTASSEVQPETIQAEFIGQESGQDALSGSASVAISAQVNAQETGLDNLIASGDIIISGGLTAQEDSADTFFGTQDQQPIISGSLFVTEQGGDSASSSGLVLVGGGLSALEMGSDVFLYGDPVDRLDSVTLFSAMYAETKLTSIFASSFSARSSINVESKSGSQLLDTHNISSIMARQVVLTSKIQQL